MYTANPHAYDLHFDWEGETWAVPEWFSNRELSQQKMLAVRNSGDEDGRVASETDKAVRVVWEVEYGRVSLWVPKSVLVSPDQLRDSARKAVDRRAKNDRYYQYLRNLAKDNGVKLGSVRKWDKIKAKLSDAGVGYVEYGDFDESADIGDRGIPAMVEVDGVPYRRVG